MRPGPGAAPLPPPFGQRTTGLRDGGWLDIYGSPLTYAATITERFRRTNFGTLKIDVADLIEFVCQENERSTPHMVGR